jgi:ABC-type Fe3+-siderophore transport system permease subunit
MTTHKEETMSMSIARATDVRLLRSRRQRRPTLTVLSIAGLAYAMLSSAVVPALPTIQHDLHTSETGVAWLLLSVSETTTWGWGSPKTLGLLAAGLAVCAAWVVVEARSEQPLIDMNMMRIRGVWTTNLTAFLLGAGLYSSFVVFPQFAQVPTSTGFGFGFGA